MSVCGEVENLEWEIKVKEEEIEVLRKRIDSLLNSRKLRDMTDKERRRARERQEINQAWYDGDGAELFE